MRYRWGSFFVMGSLLLGIVAMQYRLWQPSGAVMAYRLNEEVQAQLAVNASWQNKNQRLKQKLSALNQNPAAIEHYARTELGMIKPGETFYLIYGEERP